VPPAPPRVADSLVIGVVGEPASLLGDDPVGRIVAGLVVEPLVRRTATEDLEPRLATSVPTVENGDLRVVADPQAPGGRLVATFHLRDGVRWHDGRPLTAGDVRFAYEQDREARPGTDERIVADRMESVEAVDERTVRVTYRAEERYDLYALAPRALPRHLLESADAAARDQYSRSPIHAGAYRIAGRAPGVVTLEAFPGHVLGAPRIRRIVVRSYSSRTILLGAVLAGEVDIAPSPAFDADLAATLERSTADRGLQILYTPAQAVAMLRFGPRLAEPAIREAAALTVDRERTARAVFGGRARIPSSYLVAPLWAAAEIGGATRLDRARANALLERAGYRRGNFGIAERGADRLIVTLIVPVSSPALLEAARGVAVDLAVLGIAVQVSERPLSEVDDRVARGDFDLAVREERADDPLIATDRFRGAVSPWWDVLSEAARDTRDRTEARPIYAEMQRLWSDAVPALPLYQVLKVDVVPARLDGARPAAHAAPLTWNASEWRLGSR
jgi:peptide/nickel transport system substrate-binding protein